MSKRSGSQPARWIVQGPDVVSGKLSEALKGKGIRQVEQVASDVIVISTTVDGAERLKAEFPALIVEADSKVEPFR